MKNALYIHGFGSDKNSNTGQKVREILKNKYNVMIETWDLTNPQETAKKINKYVADKDIRIVVASSLGAFYALSISDSVARMVINPCMDPAIELPKITQISQEIKDEFNLLKETQRYYLDWEMRAVTFGIFGNNDELLDYQDDFKRVYGNMTVLPGGHRLPEKSLEEGINEGLEYFAELQESLRQIDNII